MAKGKNKGKKANQRRMKLRSDTAVHESDDMAVHESDDTASAAGSEVERAEREAVAAQLRASRATAAAQLRAAREEERLRAEKEAAAETTRLAEEARQRQATLDAQAARDAETARLAEEARQAQARRDAQALRDAEAARIAADAARATGTTATAPPPTAVNVASASERCTRFVMAGDETTLSQRWLNWLERFRIYLSTAKHLSSDGDKLNSLLLHMCEDSFEKYAALKDPGDSFDAVVKKLTEHFAPKKSLFAARQALRNLERHPEESMDNFAVRLRTAAASCEFGRTYEDQVLHVLVSNSKFERFQSKCCRMPDADKLTIAEALEIARGYEQDRANVEALNRAKTVHFADARRIQPGPARRATDPGPRPSNSACAYCGGAQHANRQDCPAKGKVCRGCGKPDHFQRVCRAKIEAPTPRQQDHRRQQNRNVRAIAQEPGDFRLSAADYAEFQRYKQAQAVELYVVNGSGPRVQATIEGVVVTMLVDTGAPSTLIDETTWQQIDRKSVV